VLLFVNILSVIEVLVPRHDTNLLGCRALWHGTALPGLLSAVPGPEWWHGGTTRHGTVKMPCLIVPCLIVPCRAVLVPYRARAARLENFNDGPARAPPSAMADSHGGLELHLLLPCARMADSRWTFFIPVPAAMQPVRGRIVS